MPASPTPTANDLVFDGVTVTHEPFDVSLATFYSPAPDWPRYRALVELGVRAGDPLAMYAMATWFMYGHRELGVRRHPTRWVPLLRAAARTLHRAMYDLGVAKLAGESMAEDRRGAYRLFARAAEGGCLTAMVAQGRCLLLGVGVRKDPRRGRALLRRAQALTGALTAIAARPARARHPG